MKTERRERENEIREKREQKVRPREVRSERERKRPRERVSKI